MAVRPPRIPAAIALAVLIGATAPAEAQEGPARIAFGPDGALLVTDYKAQSVLTVSPDDLSVLDSIPVEGRPMGLAYNAEAQQIYVGNETTSRVQVFDREGACVGEFDTPIVLPNDVKYDRATGLVYVVATKDRRVKVFDSQGVFLRDIPAEGQTVLGNPVAVAIVRPQQPGDLDGDDDVDIADLVGLLQNWGPCPSEACLADLDSDGFVAVNDLMLLLAGWGLNTEPPDIYVSDHGDSMEYIKPAVRIYDEQGVYLRRVRGGFSRPHGLHVENADYFFLVDSFVSQVMLVDQATGANMLTLGEWGADSGQMNLPLDLVIDRGTRDVFVTDNRNGRIHVFRQGGQLP